MTQTRLVEQVEDLTQSRLSRVEANKAVMGSDELLAATIAAATGVTVEWLERGATPILHGVSPHFRSRSRTTESTKASGLAWASLVNEAYDTFLSYAREMPVLLEDCQDLEPRVAARLVRRALGFGQLEPLPYLILAVERLGVRVLGLPWRADTVDAFCGWSGGQPIIALATGVPGDRLRWSVAHEVGHLVLHRSSGQGRSIESDADAFAAELLTPVDAMRLHMPAQPTLKSLTMLKTQWGVSVKSLVRRAKELGSVDDDRATGLYRQISARGWNKAEPGYVPREKPRGLRKMLEIAVGRSDAEPLAREMGWSFELASEVLGEYARADELPVLGDHASGVENVVSLHAPRNRAL